MLKDVTPNSSAGLTCNFGRRALTCSTDIPTRKPRNSGAAGKSASLAAHLASCPVATSAQAKISVKVKASFLRFMLTGINGAPCVKLESKWEAVRRQMKRQSKASGRIRKERI